MWISTPSAHVEMRLAGDPLKSDLWWLVTIWDAPGLSHSKRAEREETSDVQGLSPTGPHYDPVAWTYSTICFLAVFFLILILLHRAHFTPSNVRRSRVKSGKITLHVFWRNTERNGLLGLMSIHEAALPNHQSLQRRSYSYCPWVRVCSYTHTHMV